VCAPAAGGGEVATTVVDRGGRDAVEAPLVACVAALHDAYLAS